MKIVFVQSEFVESLAIGLFSSMLKKRGHECFLVYDQKLFDSMEIQNKLLFKIFDIRDRLAEEVESLRPDLVAFSVLTDQYQWALDMARRIKSMVNVPIIFGGVHVTIVPDETIKNDCVDIICIGEGEGALLDLVDSMQDGKVNYKIDNLWFKNDGDIVKNNIRPIITDLDKFPFPDKVLFYEKEKYIADCYGLISGRGCPFSCTFCASDVINRLSCKSGSYVRRRSYQNVVNEIIYARDKLKFPIKVVNFFDDTFTYDIKWLRGFCELYKEKVRLPFHCTGYPTTINYKKMRLLKDAGCFKMGIGIQSASEKIRRTVLNRPGTNEQIKRAAFACKDTGVNFWFDHILNIPYETEEDQIEALRFYNEIRQSIINIFWLIYYPKTKIIDIAYKAGMLNEETIKKINKGETSTAMVVGVGGQYSFSKERIFANIAFLFHILPLLPKSWMNVIIAKRMFMNPKFKPPILLNVFIKLLVRVKLRQAVDSLWFIRVLIKSMYRNLYNSLEKQDHF